MPRFYIGNCLFNALSDQIYGHQNRHAEIRKAVVQYMREHPDRFKPFVTVGKEQRRNPKRKNAGALSSTLVFVPATEAETDAAFEDYLARMAQAGTWGDNFEIQAFAHVYDTNVRIYNPQNKIDIIVAEDDIVRPTAYIAHHVRDPSLATDGRSFANSYCHI